MKLKLFLLSAFIIILPITFAEDIVMSVNQSVYYFLVGEQATIPIELNNSYGKQINGLLEYTIKQEVSQQWFQYSSINTKSTSVIIENGKNTVPLSFGTSNTPLTLEVDLGLSYDEKGQREVNLDKITINFVSDNSQKKNKQEKLQSSSQKSSGGQQQNPLKQSSQQMQQRMEANKQQAQTPQQRLQNNQLAQDSFALKQQIQKQIREQKQLKEEFQKQLSQNEEFQKYDEQLQKQGFNQENMEFFQEGNRTNLELNYKDIKNQTATIKAEFANNTIQKIELKKNNSKDMYYWLLFLFLLIIGYFLYKKYTKRTVLKDKNIRMFHKKPFDYRSEANELLQSAKKAFEQKKFKDAYGKAAQALRLFLSHENNLKKELTNYEILKVLKGKNKEHKEIRKCFDLCSLVEFAKYHANKKDFDKIIMIASNTINEK